MYNLILCLFAAAAVVVLDECTYDYDDDDGDDDIQVACCERTSTKDHFRASSKCLQFLVDSSDRIDHSVDQFVLEFVFVAFVAETMAAAVAAS